MAPQTGINWEEPNKNAENGTTMNATNGNQVYILNDIKQRGGETTDAWRSQWQYQQAAISNEELAICNIKLPIEKKWLYQQLALAIGN